MPFENPFREKLMSLGKLEYVDFAFQESLFPGLESHVRSTDLTLRPLNGDPRVTATPVLERQDSCLGTIFDLVDFAAGMILIPSKMKVVALGSIVDVYQAKHVPVLYTGARLKLVVLDEALTRYPEEIVFFVYLKPVPCGSV
jgi:hypothetical protein